MMMMTPQAILLNVHKKQIPRDIVNMILDYVITPNDKECFTLCIKDWCYGFNRLPYPGIAYAKWFAARQIKKRETDRERTSIYHTLDYGVGRNKERTHILSYIDRVNQSSDLYGFEKTILIQRYNKIKKDYEMKKEMGHQFVMPEILKLVRKRIILNTYCVDVKKTLNNNNIDLDTQYKQQELIGMLNRKHNMKRASETIKLKYKDPDSFETFKKPVFKLLEKNNIIYSFVKETAKMVVYELEKGDGKLVRKKKSNIYDWYVKNTHKDTKKEEEELKYVCRKINGFDNKVYKDFTIINKHFDYNDYDIKWVLTKINPYHNAWHDNFGQTK